MKGQEEAETVGMVPTQCDLLQLLGISTTVVNFYLIIAFILTNVPEVRIPRHRKLLMEPVSDPSDVWRK